MHQQYYEGILQLRNHNKEILEFINSQLSKRENVFITKEAKINNGIDLYLTSQKYLQSLGKKLQQRFGGELKISRKLHTTNRQTSRYVYRVNVLFRLPKFKKNDIIEVRGEQIKVISIGKKIFGREITKGKKVLLDYKNLPRSLI